MVNLEKGTLTLNTKIEVLDKKNNNKNPHQKKSTSTLRMKLKFGM